MRFLFLSVGEIPHGGVQDKGPRNNRNGTCVVNLYPASFPFPPMVFFFIERKPGKGRDWACGDYTSHPIKGKY